MLKEIFQQAEEYVRQTGRTVYIINLHTAGGDVCGWTPTKDLAEFISEDVIELTKEELFLGEYEANLEGDGFQDYDLPEEIEDPNDDGSPEYKAHIIKLNAEAEFMGNYMSMGYSEFENF